MGLGGGLVGGEHSAAEPAVDGYARYVLAVLFCVYLSNHIDRQILMILLEPIKTEFGVSDFMMGFLSGPTFALFYTCLGIPIARWADRSSRRRILAISLTVWSAMTALSGAARGFWTLAALRVGVGAGEAGCSPPAHSLISDYFPAASRARALGIFVAGGQAGSAFGWLLGGWIFYWLGWRLTFVIVGVPGLLLALLVALTVREPPRGANEGGGGAPLPFRDALQHLLRQRSYVWLQAGSALHAVAGYGLAVWVAPFLMRVHGLEIHVIGTWFGLIALFVGMPGMLLGGYIADKLVPRDPRWYLWIPILSALLSTPFTIGFLFLGNPTWALCSWIGHTLIMMTHSAPGAALTQTVIKVRARSLAVAVHMLVGNLIGLGLGPVAIGAMNDALHASYGDHAIRYTMLLATLTNVAACGFYLMAARSVRRDMDQRDA
jgi:predicted MFS family arabinose efflux permease